MITIRRVKVFLINGIILTLSSLFMRSIAMVFGVYISNTIGTETLGVYQLILSIYMFFITLANSGVNLASTRIVSEELAIKDVQGAKKAIKQCITLSLFIGISAGLLLFFSSKFIAANWVHGKISHIPFCILSIELPFMALSGAVNGYFSALRKVSKTATAQVFEQFIRIGVTVYFLSLLLKPDSIEKACLALVLGSSISEVLSTLYTYLLYKLENRRLEENFRKEYDYKKRILKISAPVAVTSYIRSGLSALKNILIPIRLEKSGISCEIALSQYGIVSGMVMPIMLFPSTFITAFAGLLIPEFSDYNLKKNYKQMDYVIGRILKISFLFSIFIIGIFWTFSNELSLAIYNNSDVSFFIKILAPLAVFMYVDTIIDGFLKGLNKQVGVMLVNILDLFSSIACIYFLVPVLGIYGYIFAIFFSEVLNFIVSLAILIKTVKFHFDILNWIIKPIIGILFAFFALKFFNINHSISILSLCLNILLFFLYYLIFLIVIGTVKSKDFKF